MTRRTLVIDASAHATATTPATSRIVRIDTETSSSVRTALCPACEEASSAVVARLLESTAITLSIPAIAPPFTRVDWTLSRVAAKPLPRRRHPLPARLSWRVRRQQLPLSSRAAVRTHHWSSVRVVEQLRVC